ncbi:toxin-antitoxin system YwqK family antitoxin [Larkinella sp. VNQ87]|uniref:toxin-antitoxin system YwqK family antitoxin n=1 Tax=Larkinella sp. VNQ87 TaxID=3400921 RepID=UPI003C07227B
MNAFYLLCFTSLLLARPDDETKKRNRLDNRVERRQYRNSIEEITYHDRWKKVATVRLFDLNNQRLAEEHYSDFQQRIRHGRARFWYPTGQLHWTCDFKENQINGPFFSYYEDGTLKRRELYRQGFARKGECYTADGTAVDCQPLVQPSDFEGGSKKFVQFLRERLRKFQPTNPSQFITLEGSLSEEGILFGLHPVSYIEQRSAEREMVRQMVEALRDMPRWRPMIIDDQPVQSDVLISIYFSDGKLFSASYGANAL